jgi:hypothetical protein
MRPNGGSLPPASRRFKNARPLSTRRRGPSRPSHQSRPPGSAAAGVLTIHLASEAHRIFRHGDAEEFTPLHGRQRVATGGGGALRSRSPWFSDLIARASALRCAPTTPLRCLRTTNRGFVAGPRKSRGGRGPLVSTASDSGRGAAGSPRSSRRHAEARGESRPSSTLRTARVTVNLCSSDQPSPPSDRLVRLSLKVRVSPDRAPRLL